MSNAPGPKLRRPIRRKREVKEMDKKWRGGATINFNYLVGWPFASLTVNSENLILKIPRFILPIFGGTYRFKREQVSRISVFRVIILYETGIQIHHNVSSYPKEITFRFWNGKRKEILSELAKCGYNIDTTSKDRIRL